MRSLPRTFLQKIASQYQLTEFEQDAFVERIADMEKTDLVIAKILNISRDRYSSRMTNVYKKFNITGNGPGKARTLFFKVLDTYQKESPSDSFQITNDAIDILVQEVQQKNYELIQNKCGSMRILDMSNPVGIKDIFTEVKITDQITSSRYLEVSELIKKINPEIDSKESELEKFNIHNNSKISGIELIKHTPKLMILGKPGAGKTTFLKHIALLCNESKVLPGSVPVFVSLKDFCNQNRYAHLSDYILTDFKNCKVSEEEFNRLLNHSKLIFLLDGLDEVREQDISHAINQVKELSQSFRKNRFIITCRLAANDYKFENFAEVEICDFNKNQIRTFARNWFTAKEKIQRAEKFIERVEENTRIQELATNPLLLTLLCLVFEDSGDFPLNRSELYEEGLDVLLRKWDANRDIDRPQAYKNLSRHRKEDLLSHIAYVTFEKNEYFFKRKSIEHEIRKYIYNLPSSIMNPETIELDCYAILRSIEAQHGLIVEVAKGIYSFSHLTFHEFFVSKKIAKTIDPEEQKQTLGSLIEHIDEHRWREVFLLVSCMLPNADYLIRLMKSKIDSMIGEREKFISFTSWLNEKTSSIEGCKISIGLKALNQVLYFNLLTMRRDTKVFDCKGNRDCMLDSELIMVLNHGFSIIQNVELTLALASRQRSAEAIASLKEDHSFLLVTLKRCIDKLLKCQLKEKLKILCKELPPKFKISDQWWVNHGQEWGEKLKSELIRCRNIGHDWNFTSDELKILKRYYDANSLLSTCLNGDCYVSREVREEIMRSTLLPIEKIPPIN